jgi:exosortase K
MMKMTFPTSNGLAVTADVGKRLNAAAGLLVENAAYLLPALALVVTLKHHYSQAGSEDLRWILRPTARLVELFSGIGFEPSDAGFLSRSRGILIAPACAGVNFLIIAFSMAVFAGLRHIRSRTAKGVWLVVAAGGAYAATIFVNSLRIIASIYSYEARIYSGWVTPERVHRLEGVLIYFFFLSLFYRIIDAVLARFSYKRGEMPLTAQQHWKLLGRDPLSAAVPLLCYLGMTVLVPLINGAASGGANRFVEHIATVVGIALFFSVALLVVESGWRRIRSRARD